MGAGGEVVATTLGVDEIDGFGDVEALQEMPAKTTYVGHLKRETGGQFSLNRKSNASE